MLTTNDDDGYETDATVPAEEYDSETERAFNAKNRKRKMSTPSTPEPMKRGPEPSTEILTKTGSPLYTRIEGYEGMVPYTSNSFKIGQIPLDRNGNPIELKELPRNIQLNLSKVEVKGGVAKSRRRRRAKKSSRKRNSRHTRKSAHKRRARSRRSNH
jgi:hypothetical protein